MSAKYKCDVCGRKLPCHNNKIETYEWVNIMNKNLLLRVQFIIDFNQYTNMDICKPCALKAIQGGAKESTKNPNNISSIKHPENCNYY